ncbi:MAG: glycogen debranching N-terminal domain-containing protein [Kineosporiaceae bacterium]
MRDGATQESRPDGPARPPRQPWFHDLVPVLSSPTQAWGPVTGDVTGHGVEGYVHADVRVLRRATVTVAGADVVPVGHHVRGAADVAFAAMLRGVGDGGADSTVRLERTRTVSPGEVTERLVLSSWAAGPVVLDVRADLTADLTPMDTIKRGRGAPAPAVSSDADGSLEWSDATTRVSLVAPGAGVDVTDAAIALSWAVELHAHGSAEVSWRVSATRNGMTDLAVAPSGPALSASGFTVQGDDDRLAGVVERALSDLDGLRTSIARSPEDDFVAAGAPWFLTLFGRDSLWAARMLLPVSTDLAHGTLHLLAAVQGTRVDPVAAEAPGKIIHEIRAESFEIDSMPGEAVERSLPPVYYGTIDATLLWILTLHDAWRWGMPRERVAGLLPALERALAWMPEHGDTDGDGFLEYADESGTGLSNQGWKDSGDAIRDPDGALPVQPLALCEVQGYAYAAALAGAALLDEFGRGGGDRYRAWAERLRDAFRRSFWVADGWGRYPAVALDGDKRPVASLTSNVGHLLGTGLLDPEEEALITDLLASPALFSGFGVRTMAAGSPGYSPQGYHVGSVWPHDTSICLAGMAAGGHPAAATVAAGLLDAVAAFDGRPPELFAGDQRSEQEVPLPHPAACFPQAWSSAAVVHLLTTVAGLRPEGGALVADPVRPWVFGAMSLHGVRVGERTFTVRVDADGAAAVEPAD